MSDIDYSLTQCRRRSIAIRIDESGQVWVRAPKWISRQKIHGFVQAKQDWIRQKRAEISAHQSTKPSFESGALFSLLGKSYALRFEADLPDKRLIFRDGQFILATRLSERAEIYFVRWYREFASDFLSHRLHELATQFGFSVREFKLSNATRSWGACTARGIIRLNWRLVLAPPDIVDYVICHELAHLKHLNHSARFWELVGELCPRWHDHRRWLRVHGHRLVLGAPLD